MPILFYPLCASGDLQNDDPYLNMPLIAWSNLFERGSAAASSFVADGSFENAWSGTYDFWVPVEMPAWVSVELGSAAEADCLAIAAHTLGTSRTTVIVEYLVGEEWTEAASAIPSDDTALILVFPAITSAAWRVRLIGTAVPVVGAMNLGKALIMEGGVQGDHAPLTVAGRSELLVNVSLAGHVVGRSVTRRSADGTISFAPMTTAWVRGPEFDAFRQHFNDGLPFFFAWAPMAWPEDVSYCQRRSGDGTEIVPEHRGMYGGSMYVDMQVEAFL